MRVDALQIDDLSDRDARTFEPRPFAAWVLLATGEWVAPLGTGVPTNLPLGGCVRRVAINTEDLRP